MPTERLSPMQRVRSIVEVAEDLTLETMTDGTIFVQVITKDGTELAAFRLEPEHAYQVARDMTKASAYVLARRVGTVRDELTAPKKEKDDGKE